MDEKLLEPLTIALGNNLDVAVILTKPSLVAGERFRQIPDSGRSLTAFLSLGNGPTAAAIHASLSVAVPEIGTSGAYYNEILGTAITTHLTTYADTATDVFLVVVDGTTRRASARCRVVSAQSLRVA